MCCVLPASSSTMGSLVSVFITTAPVLAVQVPIISMKVCGYYFYSQI